MTLFCPTLDRPQLLFPQLRCEWMSVHISPPCLQRHDQHTYLHQIWCEALGLQPFLEPSCFPQDTLDAAGPWGCCRGTDSPVWDLILVFADQPQDLHRAPSFGIIWVICRVRRQVIQRQFEVRGQPVVKPGRRALLGSFWELEGWSRGQIGTSRARGTLRQGITSARLIHSSILFRLGCSIFFLWEDYFCFLKLRKVYVWCQKRWRRCMIYINFIFFM